MNAKPGLLSEVFEGWHAYQAALAEALRPLDEDQLALRVGPKLRTVDQYTF